MDLGRPSGLCRGPRRHALLYVTHDADLASTIKERQLAPDIFLWVTDIDSVYAQHRAAKADIAEELTCARGEGANMWCASLTDTC